MKTLWVVTVVAGIAIACGCGTRGGPTPGAVARDADTAEAAADKSFEASKAGDVDTVVGYFDLKGAYDEMSDEQRGDMD
jgi:hypothetical protein